MNRKQLLVIFCAINIIAQYLVRPAYPYVSAKMPEILQNFEGAITDQQLGDLAIEKGIIPPNIDEAYLKNQIDKGNSITAWIVTERDYKIALIDKVKTMFKDRQNIIIKAPSAYYVDEINALIYSYIEIGDIDEVLKPVLGVGAFFRLIATMGGDFNNGI